MSERDLLRETAARLFAETCPPEAVQAAEGGWVEAAWTSLEQAGMSRIGVREDLGGDGGELADALVLVEEAGAHAAPVPIAESALIGGWLCERAGLPMPAGALAVAAGGVRATADDHGVVLEGRVDRVAFASVASHLLVVASDDEGELLAVLEPGAYDLVAGANLAAEPRDTVVLDGARADAWARLPDGTPAALEQRGAFARTVSMAGALRTLLDLTVRYAREREQFGRPIGRFQAVRQLLARLASQVAMSTAATSAAARAVAAGGGGFEVAAAKVAVGAAATEATQIAHQIHGAIGMTDEHVLQHYSRRLWSWRDEFGNESRWSTTVTARVEQVGADGLWPLLTEGSEA